MIEHRKLTRDELNILINEAVYSETKFLKDLNVDIYNFFRDNSIIQDGLVVDKRPIYISALIRNKNGRINFWTVVNSNINCGITLTKYSKKQLNNWVNIFGTIYATMEKVSPLNMKWVKWLGFVEFEEDDNYITYKIGV